MSDLKSRLLKAAAEVDDPKWADLYREAALAVAVRPSVWSQLGLLFAHCLGLSLVMATPLPLMTWQFFLGVTLISIASTIALSRRI